MSSQGFEPLSSLMKSKLSPSGLPMYPSLEKKTYYMQNVYICSPKNVRKIIPYLKKHPVYFSRDIVHEISLYKKVIPVIFTIVLCKLSVTFYKL